MNRPTAMSPFPPPPSDELMSKLEGLFPSDDKLPTTSSPKLIDTPSTMARYPLEFPSCFYDYIADTFQRHAVTCVNFDFGGHFDDRYNLIMLHIITVVVREAITVGYMAKKKAAFGPADGSCSSFCDIHTLQDVAGQISRSATKSGLPGPTDAGYDDWKEST